MIDRWLLLILNTNFTGSVRKKMSGRVNMTKHGQKNLKCFIIIWFHFTHATAEQPATVADTITATPTTSNVAGSRITLSWTAPVDGGSAIVGYAVWYNATHKQVSIQVVRLMVLFSFAHIF